MTNEDDFDDLDDDWWDEHGWECECDACSLGRHLDECGRLPRSLGGGCELAGTEHCDFVCPFRDEEE